MKAFSDILACRVSMERVRVERPRIGRIPGLRFQGVRRIAYVVVTMAGVSLPSVPAAYGQSVQQGASGDPARTSSDPVLDSLLALPAYRREHLQTHPAMYERYRRPSLCRAAMGRARMFYYRDKRPDTIFATIRDAVTPPVVRQVANACIGKFDLARVPTNQLGPLPALYLVVNQQRLMDSAYRRILRENPARDTTEIRLKANQLLSVRHQIGMVQQLSDWSWMRRVAADIDSLGPSAAQFSMIANDDREWAVSTLDADFAIEGYEKADAAYKKMTRSEIVDWGNPMRGKYMDLARFQFWKDPRAEVVSDFIEKRFVPTFASFAPGNTAYLEQLRNMGESWTAFYQFYEEPAPPMPAKHWFYPDGKQSGKLSWQGQPTLVMFVQPNCGGGCFSEFSLAKILHEKFGARGLRIVFVASTSGYFRTQLPERSADEVELIRNYFHDFLKLPVILAIDEVRFSRLPDGRRIPEDIAWYRSWPTSHQVLIDREGKIKSLLKTRVERMPYTVSEIEKVL